MQLAMLAPYNNLATSVAAALVPTLLRSTIPVGNESKQNFTFTSDTEAGECNVYYLDSFCLLLYLPTAATHTQMPQILSCNSRFLEFCQTKSSIS